MKKIYKSTDPSSINANQKKYKKKKSQGTTKSNGKTPINKIIKTARRKKRHIICKGTRIEMITSSSKTVQTKRQWTYIILLKEKKSSRILQPEKKISNKTKGK